MMVQFGSPLDGQTLDPATTLSGLGPCLRPGVDREAGKQRTRAESRGDRVTFPWRVGWRVGKLLKLLVFVGFNWFNSSETPEVCFEW